jgi:hypothetical protein
MDQIATRISELVYHNEYKGVMIYIYSNTMDILQKMKDKILQMEVKITATFGIRRYYESRPMLIIEGDFSTEQLKDIFDYLSGQNVAFTSVNESGLLSISNSLANLKNNKMPGREIIPDELEELELNVDH